jgi:hypothetical protein
MGRAEEVDEGMPFVREYRNSDCGVPGVRKEGGDVGAHGVRLVEDAKHGQAVPERKRRRRRGEDIDGSEVVETLHPGRYSRGQGSDSGGRRCRRGVEATAHHVSKVVKGQGGAAAAAAADVAGMG